MIRQFFDVAGEILLLVLRGLRPAIYVPGTGLPVSGVPVVVVGTLGIVYSERAPIMVLPLPGWQDTPVPGVGAVILHGCAAVLAVRLVKDAANWLYTRLIAAKHDYVEALTTSTKIRFVAALLESVCMSALLEYAVACTACWWAVPGTAVLVLWSLTVGTTFGAAARDRATTRRTRIMRAVDTITGAMAVDASLPSGTDSTRHAVAANAIDALRTVSADDAIEVLEVCENPGNELKADQRHLWEYMFQRIDALRAKRTT